MGVHSLDRGQRLSTHVFEKLRQLTKQHTGIDIPPGHQSMMVSRIQPLMSRLQIDRYEDFLNLLEQNGSGQLQPFLNAMTTNLTAFFRENHHFEYLSETVLPQLIEKKRRVNRKIRVWSAGCSSGEEPYSIAMVFLEAIKDLKFWDFRILATDLDTGTLAKGKAGVYQLSPGDKLEKDRIERWFLKGSENQHGLIKVKPEVRRLVAFRHLNLLGHWPMKGMFDLIFCRNVLIYFDDQTKEQIIGRFSRKIEDKGHLFVGHSENLLSITNSFELYGGSIYRKK